MWTECYKHICGVYMEGYRSNSSAIRNISQRRKSFKRRRSNVTLENFEWNSPVVEKPYFDFWTQENELPEVKTSPGGITWFRTNSSSSSKTKDGFYEIKQLKKFSKKRLSLQIVPNDPEIVDLMSLISLKENKVKCKEENREKDNASCVNFNPFNDNEKSFVENIFDSVNDFPEWDSSYQDQELDLYNFDNYFIKNKNFEQNNSKNFEDLQRQSTTPESLHKVSTTVANIIETKPASTQTFDCIMHDGLCLTSKSQNIIENMRNMSSTDSPYSQEPKPSLLSHPETVIAVCNPEIWLPPSPTSSEDDVSQTAGTLGQNSVDVKSNKELSIDVAIKHSNESSDKLFVKCRKDDRKQQTESSDICSNSNIKLNSDKNAVSFIQDKIDSDCSTQKSDKWPFANVSHIDGKPVTIIIDQSPVKNDIYGDVINDFLCDKNNDTILSETPKTSKTNNTEIVNSKVLASKRKSERPQKQPSNNEVIPQKPSKRRRINEPPNTLDINNSGLVVSVKDSEHGKIPEEKPTSSQEESTSTRVTRSSTRVVKIRKTLPKAQVRHTPMGLPKPNRLKKKQFSVEEIYLNKNYVTPTEKTWETIFEYPKQEQSGTTVYAEKRKKRRAYYFSTDPSARKKIVGKRARKKITYFPKKVLKRPELDEILENKLQNLNRSLAYA